MTDLIPQLRKDRVDVLHAQYLLPPLGFVPCPMVVTVHDATFRLFPEWFPKRANRLQNTLIPISSRRADRVLTVSHCAAEDLHNSLGIPRDKIMVTFNGVGDEFRPQARSFVESVRAHHGLPERYLLGVGILRRRKNTAVVLRAMELLVQRGEWPEGAVLALTGNWADSDAETVYRNSPQLGPLVRTLGFVDDEHLPALYAGASGTVYPSLYEGFGIPAIESMACGTPVATSNTSSLPEVVGDAGLLLPTDDTEAWARALSMLLGDSQERKDLISRGLIRAQKFTWEQAAHQTMAVYEAVVRQPATRPAPSSVVRLP
jgi:glycosyltransferase involved in cell wall biosynthesis